MGRGFLEAKDMGNDPKLTGNLTGRKYAAAD